MVARRDQHRRALVADLIGGVAHEINNPVQSIMNYAQLLRVRLQDPTLAGFADEILDEAKRIASIVHNLRSLARGGDAMKTEVAPGSVVEDVVGLTSSLLHREGIVPDVSIVEGLPRVTASAQDLKHVLLTLVMGARGALNRGARDRSSAKRLALRVEPVTRDGAPWVRWVVADWGQPLAAAEVVSVLDGGVLPPDRDRGMGAAWGVVQVIAKEHRGELGVSSLPEGQTCFTLELPAVRVE